MSEGFSDPVPRLFCGRWKVTKVVNRLSALHSSETQQRNAYHLLSFQSFLPLVSPLSPLLLPSTLFIPRPSLRKELSSRPFLFLYLYPDHRRGKSSPLRSFPFLYYFALKASTLIQDRHLQKPAPRIASIYTRDEGCALSF